MDAPPPSLPGPRRWRHPRALLSVATLFVLGLFAGFLATVDLVCLRGLWAAGSGQASPVGAPVSRTHAVAFHVAFGAAVVSYVSASLREPGAVPQGWVEGDDEGNALLLRLAEEGTVAVVVGGVEEGVKGGLCSSPSSSVATAGVGAGTGASSGEAGVAAEGRREGAPVEVKRSTGGARWCKHCTHAKPPRAHHCRSCRACVLRMDHHCLWLDTCVGHHNHKAFFCFLGWTSVALCDATYILGRTLGMATLVRRSETRPGSLDVVMYLHAGQMSSVVTALVLGVGLAVGVGFLCLWHTHLLGANRTTIEMHEGVRVTRRDGTRKTKADYENPYDLGGWLANAKEVLGPNPLTWMIPTASHGDGIHWGRRRST